MMISAPEVVEVFEELVPGYQAVEDVGPSDDTARPHVAAPRRQGDG